MRMDCHDMCCVFRVKNEQKRLLRKSFLLDFFRRMWYNGMTKKQESYLWILISPEKCFSHPLRG